MFLVWLWLTNIAILLGAEYDAERARTQHIKAGHSARDEPYVPARSQPLRRQSEENDRDRQPKDSLLFIDD